MHLMQSEILALGGVASLKCRSRAVRVKKRRRCLSVITLLGAAYDSAHITTFRPTFPIGLHVDLSVHIAALKAYVEVIILTELNLAHLLLHQHRILHPGRATLVRRGWWIIFGVVSWAFDFDHERRVALLLLLGEQVVVVLAAL